MLVENTKWPKRRPNLTPEQADAREKWMRLWHETLLQRYSAVEKFNHSYPSSLFSPKATANQAGNQTAIKRTLEVGAGLGEHVKWEDLKSQDYTMLEYRKEWCEQLRTQNPGVHVILGDIERRLDFADGYFDRVIAIHVLEHLPNLPKALAEIYRLLAPGGQFDIVIPCEGGLAYEFARTISSKRMFKKHFGMSYDPIIRAEHLSTCDEILLELNRFPWKKSTSRYFPLRVPLWTANLCLGLQYRKI